MMFFKEEYNIEYKLILIIIIILVVRVYDKIENIVDVYLNIVSNMWSYIEIKRNFKIGIYERWVINFVNDEENFVDKWVDEFKKEEYFYVWFDKLEEDIKIIKSS